MAHEEERVTNPVAVFPHPHLFVYTADYLAVDGTRYPRETRVQDKDTIKRARILICFFTALCVDGVVGSGDPDTLVSSVVVCGGYPWWLRYSAMVILMLMTIHDVGADESCLCKL